MTTRRAFLTSAGLAAGGSLLARPQAPAAPAGGPMIKPRALKPGDTVGLIAPASYIFDLWRIEDVAPRNFNGTFTFSGWRASSLGSGVLPT